MPSETEHIACANRTQATIVLLLSDRVTHSPWIAIAAFYKALHIIEAVFANDRSIGHTSNHDERERFLKTQRKHQQIYRHYSPLKRASLNARYLSETGSFDSYMSADDVVDTLLKHHLHQIEESAVNNFLKTPAALSRIKSAVP